MAVRNKRRCRNCPESRPVTKKTPVVEQVVLQVTERDEAEKLWKAVLSTLDSHISVIQKYHNYGLPGISVSSIRASIKRLEAILQTIEDTHDNQYTENTPSAGESDRGSGLMESPDVDGQLASQVRASDSRRNRRKRSHGRGSVLQWKGGTDRDRDDHTTGETEGETQADSYPQENEDNQGATEADSEN